MKRIAAVVCGGALVFGFAGVALGAPVLGANDNYQCYRARAKPKFAKLNASVSDTWSGSNATNVRRPFLLCDSASVVSSNGTTGTVDSTRMNCFRVRGAKLPSTRTETVTDQFGTRTQITRKKAVALCVPATTSP